MERNQLIPIIGVNESGKTTIIHALFAFDYFNDSLNDNGRHLRDIHNLYQTSDKPSVISADVALSPEEFSNAVAAVCAKTFKHDRYNDAIASYRAKYSKIHRKLSPVITISRNLKTKTYSLYPEEVFPSQDLNHLLAREFLRHLPYILFFDDFRDSVDEKIELAHDENGEMSGWLSIVERLFKKTDPNFSVFKLGEMEERTRQTVLSKVNKHLNSTLTKEWQNFRLDDTDAMRIAITYEPLSNHESGKRAYLKLHVIEKDADGDEYHFYIRDRSK